MIRGNINSLEEVSTSRDHRVKKRVLFKMGDVPPLTQLSIAVHPAGTGAAEHHHKDMTEIFIVQQGHGIITVNGEKFQAGPGDYFYLETDEKHELLNPEDASEDWEVLCIGIRLQGHPYP